MNILVHSDGGGGGGGEHTAIILRDVPCKSECRTVYDVVSRALEVPSNSLTLSNGVKILQRRLPLCVYTPHVDLAHGLNLHCCIRMLGGGSDDEDGDSSKPTPKKVKVLIMCMHVLLL